MLQLTSWSVPCRPQHRSATRVGYFRKDRLIACAAPPPACRSSSLIVVVTATSLLDLHRTHRGYDDAVRERLESTHTEPDAHHESRLSHDRQGPTRAERTRATQHVRCGRAAAPPQRALGVDPRGQAIAPPQHTGSTHTHPTDGNTLPSTHRLNPHPPDERQALRSTRRLNRRPPDERQHAPQHTPAQPNPGPVGRTASAGCVWGQPTRRPTIGLCPPDRAA